MNSLNAALLVNTLGFTVGIALYGMLAAMVVRHRRVSDSGGASVLLLATAALGLVWNAGELVLVIRQDFGLAGSFPILTAAAYSALGFLPSVVVHSAQSEAGRNRLLTVAAYILSTAAASLHFFSAFTERAVPSPLAMQVLTVGAVALTLGLLVFNFKQTLEKKAIWVTALLVFAVSSLHLSAEESASSWIVELVAHQSSLPLALAILFQNYRFAFADLFLKRAISLLLLALAAFGLYVGVAAPLLRFHETHDRNDAFAVSILLTLWIGTALLYPLLHRVAVWLVDRVILQRVDYQNLQAALAGEIEELESTNDVLDAVSRRIGTALTAGKIDWAEHVPMQAGRDELVVSSAAETSIFIPTAEAPGFGIDVGAFAGGRRLLSEEREMLKSIAILTARRIDGLRVTHERCERELREQEFLKLATEAQLSALRSQVNPHFLFNALTSIGYLIQTSPEKALQTLLHLTKLLRGVLNSSGEFSALGDEMRLIENYLDIERTRFEERLKVTIDVPAELEHIKIPSLILQPLVENAIKHGISQNKAEGELVIAARMQNEVLSLTVRDSGASRKLHPVSGKGGVGLRNIRERLASYYGDGGSLELDFNKDGSTTATISIRLGGAVRIAA
jgi:two-component system LytT family sensor kinase